MLISPVAVLVRVVVVVIWRASQYLRLLAQGLQGPRGPFSTTMGDWGLIFIVEIAVRKLERVYNVSGRKKGFRGMYMSYIVKFRGNIF